MLQTENGGSTANMTESMGNIDSASHSRFINQLWLWQALPSEESFDVLVRTRPGDATQLALKLLMCRGRMLDPVAGMSGVTVEDVLNWDAEALLTRRLAGVGEHEHGLETLMRVGVGMAS